VKPRAIAQFLTSIGVSCLVACTRASTPIPAQVGKPLQIVQPVAPTPAGFVVTFAGPAGEVAPESEIQIVFSRPLRKIATSSEAPIPNIPMRPAIEGKWRWLGTHALVFAPAQQRLPFGTEIEVEVPADLRAEDGALLGKIHRFRLQTPAPKLVSVTSKDEPKRLRSDSQFELLFDQPVESNALRSRLRLEVARDGLSEPLRYELAALRDRKPGQGYRMTPKLPLKRAATVRVIVDAGLIGLEGPRATGAPQVHEFATVQPLRVEKIDCDRATPKAQCDSRSGLDLEFNNPVSIRALRSLITVDGRRAKLAPWHADDDVTPYVHLPGPFRPGVTAVVRVAGGLMDSFGQRLEQPRVERVAFDDFFPKMEIGLQGDIFETAQPTAIPLGVVNVASYERLYVPLDLEGLAGLLSADDSDTLFARGLSTKGAELTWQTPKYRVNEMGIDAFEPAADGVSRLGAALVAVRYAGIEHVGKPVTLTDARLVQRTNLGISGEVGLHASVIWVTELDSGRPVANAEVAVLHTDGTIRERVKTDVQGIARLGPGAVSRESLDEPSKHQLAIIATQGADLAFRRISDLLPEWRVPVTVDRSGRQGARLMLFAERGLYRPGERVDVKAIMREELARGLKLPQAGSIRLELVSPDNHVVGATSKALSGFGTAAAHFAIPLSAKTGQWSVRALQDKETLGATQLTVGEYRPVELAVSVEPAKREMVRGGKLTVAVAARTLFGMAAAGANARIEASRERTSFVPPGRDDYVTDADALDEIRRDDNPVRAELLLTRRALDDQGRVEAEVSAELPAARGPEWIQFEAEVTDAGQNPVASTARTLVHPADYYVALKRLSDAWVTTPARFGVDVSAFAPDGSPAKGRSVRVELVRRTWSVVRREVDGVVQSRNEPSDAAVGTCQVKTDVGDQHCNFDVSRAGSYFVVARSRDDHNRETTAAQAFFAVGRGLPEFADEDDHRIDLVADKTMYQIGDTAKVLVKSAITDVDALVVVGRSDAHSVELRHLTGPTPILDIPIRDDMRPNMFVTVHLVTPRRRPAPSRLEQPDLGAPTYRVGWAELRIDSADRRLTVNVTPSTHVTQPGASVDVNVSVRDASSRPVRSEVTLWAVDEGVLALGNYEVPDPQAIFLGSRPLQLLPVESRDSLGRRTLSSMRAELGLPKGSPGAGGGESGMSSPLRQDFRSTAFFLSDLVTDQQGQVKAHLSMPDSLTSYRIFAVAVSGTEQFGFGGERIVTKKPLLVRPMLPRFLRDGDRAEIGVVLSSTDAPDSNATVTMTATGLTPKGGQQSKLLARGKSVELFFPVTATGETDWSVRFDAKGGGFSDSVKLSRPLRYVVAQEVAAEAGETQGRALETIGDLAGVRADRGYLELQLSSSLLGGSAGGFQQLVEYPYGCSEQISSRLMALLPLAELAKSAGVELPKDRNHLIEVAVAELLKRQNQDGGFGMWPGAESSEPWVSAHVLVALNEVTGSNRVALQPVFERGVEFLRRFGNGSVGVGTDAKALATQAYVADVLLRLGDRDPGLMSRLYAVREQMPVFAQALLLHAYGVSHHDAQATATLLGELERYVHHDGAVARVATNTGDDYARLFDSNTRTEALLTSAFAVARPEHPMLVPLARGLLSERKNGRWATTQESAFALLALDAVRRARKIESGPIEAKVAFGERELFAGTIGGKAASSVTRRIRMADLGPGNRQLSFETAPGPLLYEARLHYVSKQPVSAPIDSGFAVERSFLPVALEGTVGAAVVATPAAAMQADRGQTFLVELTVVVPRPREYVVIDAPIPAGFEAIDVTQRTSSGWMQRLDRIDAFGPEGSQGLAVHRDIRDDRVVYLVDHFPVGLYRLRHLVRAVTRGSFAVPPVRVEAMYNPEHYGTTATSLVDVR
jgi:alpha-2-macroglobulin